VKPEPDGSIRPERFAGEVDERTALVCCTTISYRTGHRHDVAEIARIAHDAGALCLADSYQAIGALDFDARELGVDFATGGTVKYLLGSAGLGFLYVRRELLPGLVPSQTGWFADENIFQMDISDYSPAADARRFDPGTPPVPNIYGGLAGMSIVEEAGTRAIEEHVAGLTARLIDGLYDLGAVVVTPREPERRGPLVCVKSTDVQTLVDALDAARIVCSERDSNLRISLHLYNVDEDVDTILAALARHRHLLA
jgi:selenocysteine lyase/cysteine desulfurase